MSTGKIEQDSEQQAIDHIERIREFALGMGFVKTYSTEQYIDKLHMESGTGNWIYVLEIESTGNSSYGFNVWLSVTDNTFFTYSLMSLYRSSYRYIANDVNRFLYLLKTLRSIPVSKFRDESIGLYLENWYNAAVLEEL